MSWIYDLCIGLATGALLSISAALWHIAATYRARQ